MSELLLKITKAELKMSDDIATELELFLQF
jgi:hypothetical protein